MSAVPKELANSLKPSSWVSICTLDLTAFSAENVRQRIRRSGDPVSSCIMNAITAWTTSGSVQRATYDMVCQVGCLRQPERI